MKRVLKSGHSEAWPGFKFDTLYANSQLMLELDLKWLFV